jgi:hypothetical protein
MVPGSAARAEQRQARQQATGSGMFAIAAQGLPHLVDEPVVWHAISDIR